MNSIFKHIDNNLLYKNRVHWDNQKLIGYFDINPLVRVALFELNDHRIYKLLENDGSLDQLYGAAVNSCY